MTDNNQGCPKCGSTNPTRIAAMYTEKEFGYKKGTFVDYGECPDCGRKVIVPPGTTASEFNG